MKHYDFESGIRPGDTLDHLMEGFQVIGFDWRYRYVNDAVVKHSKLSKEELIGYTMMERYPGIESTEMFKALQRCMHERISQHMENEFTYPDRAKGWFELSIQPIPEGIFILSIDITERKLAEEEKKKYIKGLEDMMFITSHKIRQPVTHILGASNLLELPVNSEEDVKRMIGYIKESAIALDTFTRDLTVFIHRMGK